MGVGEHIGVGVGVREATDHVMSDKFHLTDFALV